MLLKFFGRCFSSVSCRNGGGMCGRVKHRRAGGTVKFSLTSRVIPCSACCLPRRSLAEPGPNRPNCPISSRFSRRLSLVPRSSFGGWNRRREKHGAARPTPRAGENPLHRVKMLAHFFVCCVITDVPAERWSFFPSALAPSSLVLWRMEPPPGKEHGAARPIPRAGESPLHLRGNC